MQVPGQVSRSDVVDIEPKGAMKYQTGHVALYFIGVQWMQDLLQTHQKIVYQEMLKKDPTLTVDDPKVLEAAELRVKPPQIVVKQTKYVLPELGEHLFVPESHVQDVIFQTTWRGQKTMLLASEGGERMAQTLRDQIRKNGTKISALDFRTAYAQEVVQEIPDEEFVKILEARNMHEAAQELLDKIKAADPSSKKPASTQKGVK